MFAPMIPPAFEAAPNVKAMINIGALQDVPTGHYMIGQHGESILNGGLGLFTGVVGGGNLFKSTFMNYQFLTAMARIRRSSGHTYDTEVNMQEWHYDQMFVRQDAFEGENPLETGRWVITDKTIYGGTDWYKLYKAMLEQKIKDKAKHKVKTPFMNRDRTAQLEILIPTFTIMDSFTEFETDDVEEMQNKNQLGDSGANMMHQRQGLAKLRFLMAAPRLNGQSYDYLLMTAHIGKEGMLVNAGPGGQVPVQKLTDLKNGDKIKGTTDKFLFMTHNCHQCLKASRMITDDKVVTYPRNKDDDLKMDTDLNLVQVRNLRSKSGKSGMTISLVISQTEGVLAGLTEFHYIKDMDRYGLEGNNTTYSLALYPEVKLMRTTVRGKIDTDPILRRALNITAEMCQMDAIWNDVDYPYDLRCTPKELYDDLKAKGYDWNVLLRTRGWWTVDNDDHPIPFLSTMDLLKMRVGKYHPYWMKEQPVKLAA